MQPLILVLAPLIFYVLSNRALVPLLPHGVNEISACPKRSTPEKLLYLGNSPENFARRDAFDNLRYVCWTHRWY